MILHYDHIYDACTRTLLSGCPFIAPLALAMIRDVHEPPITTAGPGDGFRLGMLRARAFRIDRIRPSVHPRRGWSRPFPASNGHRGGRAEGRNGRSRCNGGVAWHPALSRWIASACQRSWSISKSCRRRIASVDGRPKRAEWRRESGHEKTKTTWFIQSVGSRVA